MALTPTQPVWPCPGAWHATAGSTQDNAFQAGLTLRNYAALEILIGLSAPGKIVAGDYAVLAAQAFALADAYIAAG